MQLTPCELFLWDRLPAIRKEFAIALITQHGLSQREAAEKLGVTPAAVCQYLARKRGKQITFPPHIQQEILISATHIVDHGSVTIETCRICRLIRQHATSTGEPLFEDP